VQYFFSLENHFISKPIVLLFLRCHFEEFLIWIPNRISIFTTMNDFVVLLVEIDFFEISVFDVVPVDVCKVKVPVQVLRILPRLNLASLLNCTVLELLESLLGVGRHLSDLSTAEPLGSLWATGTTKKG
jgi:hypothetical protein